MESITNYIYPNGSAVVGEFLYMTVCMEGKNIFSCLDEYAQHHGSGIKEDMGCYFASELDSKDPDRLGNSILVYQETNSGVTKVHISEAEFFYELEKAFKRASFLFNENEWHRIQIKLDHLKTILITD